MATMRVELMSGNDSPVSVTMEGGVVYAVAFDPPRPGGLADVPREIGMVLVSNGLARDRGQVKPPLAGPPWPAVTPEWNPDAGRVTGRPSTPEELAAVAPAKPAA